MKIWSWLGFAAVLMGILVGCEEMKPSVPDYIHKVAIPTFKNSTGQPSLDQEITQKVLQEFLVDGRLGVAPVQQADGLLEGEVTQYLLLPLVRDANQVPQQYKLQVTVDLTFTDLVKKKQLWTTRSLMSLTPQPSPDTGTAQASLELTPLADSMNTASIREFTTYWVLNTMGAPPEDEPTARLRVEDQVARRVARRTLEGY
jgi:hypothetical protein